MMQMQGAEFCNTLNDYFQNTTWNYTFCETVDNGIVAANGLNALHQRFDGHINKLRVGLETHISRDNYEEMIGLLKEK